MKRDKSYSKQDKLIKGLFWLSVLRIILPRLQDFIGTPYYWGIKAGTATEEMNIFLNVSRFYNLYVIKIVVPIIMIGILYILCEILRLIVNSIIKNN